MSHHPESHGHWDVEQIDALLWERDLLLVRVATLEADERRRIAGQIWAGMYAIATAQSEHACVTGNQVFMMADAVIRKLDATKESQS